MRKRTDEKQKMKKGTRGITLIALVVTIVVLLILAGVSINLVIGNNGIITKAGDAKKQTEQATANEQKDLLGLEDDIDKALGQYDPLKRLPSKTIDETKSSLMTENTKVTFPDGTVVVPKGFKISSETANNVQGGVVIEDKDDNQFVWIPVASIADYKRTAYSTNVATGTTDSATNSEQIKYSDSYDYYFTEAMPEDEKISVETYHGFYIGRYEAGDAESTNSKTMREDGALTTNTITLKKGQAPYNYVTKTRAQALAEEMDTKQGYSATTKLCSSYAWDTAIAFMQKTNSDYGDSSEEGNYNNREISYKYITGVSQTKSLNNSVLIPTGQTTPVCNIYDMGGNCSEWTTELCSHSSYSCTLRGGYYNDYYAVYPAGDRSNYYSNGAGAFDSFRPTLFM